MKWLSRRKRTLRVGLLVCLMGVMLFAFLAPARADLKSDTKKFIEKNTNYLREIALPIFILVFIGCGVMLLLSWGSPRMQAFAKGGMFVSVISGVLIMLAPSIGQWFFK